ncbi:SGNH/GDSL hydrolase family protein [Pedobacter frigoris]|uniref:Acetylhydrolase n=1 Tax=Pedobacter frigoris TaxID=2571272 RepID=A0A4U1CP66_9SPHI|nr:SGNH/GDSL hydrolase family protein [Pedobacter frigoris]TKC08620.1 acetylhydrolase [Pedobacter frigoris]
MIRRFLTIFSIIMLFVSGYSTAQRKEYKSWNPAKDTLNVIQGRSWESGFKSGYDRLPAAAEKNVRKAVWGLSENSSGLYMQFRTNAEEIVVKFKVTGGMAMPHMPATGVSGVDLYSKNIDGKWLWCAGRYSFGDTVSYRFVNLAGKDQHVDDREYRLYLPLYNTVKWMEISVPKEAKFKPLPVRKEKPIVVYGTSIAQGACASRPGMAWTSILGRKLDRSMVNLGFSGNGKLEPEVLDFVTQIDAKLFVLDCLPNLTGGIGDAMLNQKIVDAVRQIQKKRPGTPILMVEHDGYTDGEMQPLRKKDYEAVNRVLKSAIDSLIKSGVKGLYLLSKEEIGHDIESMVDGTHPNDLGMMRYAEAYEKKIKSIFNEPQGTVSTMIPVTQRRDASSYDWETRHQEVLDYGKANQPELVLVGNSILHYWGGEPASSRAKGKDAWTKYFAEGKAMNMGFGWDRIENVLWRIYHGELDEISPKKIILMIGTNNLDYNTDEEIVQGLKFLLDVIKVRKPAADVILMGILPRRKMEQRIAGLNKKIAAIAIGKRLKYADAGKLFLKPAKEIDESLFSDGLHPNAVGYEKLGNFINQQIKKY